MVRSRKSTRKAGSSCAKRSLNIKSRMAKPSMTSGTATPNHKSGGSGPLLSSQKSHGMDKDGAKNYQNGADPDFEDFADQRMQSDGAMQPRFPVLLDEIPRQPALRHIAVIHPLAQADRCVADRTLNRLIAGYRPSAVGRRPQPAHAFSYRQWRYQIEGHRTYLRARWAAAGNERKFRSYAIASGRSLTVDIPVHDDDGAAGYSRVPRESGLHRKCSISNPPWACSPSSPSPGRSARTAARCRGGRSSSGSWSPSRSLC